MNKNKLVAHRGDNTHYPENSYAGIEAALRAGARFVEFDIQLNADQSLVVFHDTDFTRTTNQSGDLFKTSDVQLKTFSAHEPKRFGEQHYPTHIPHLEEIMTLFKRYPKAHAFVEIKVESLNQWGLSKVMNKLLEALKDHQIQASIISFSYDALKYTQENSELKTGLVFNQNKKEIRKQAYDLKPDYMICPYQLVEEKILWEGDWQWMVYSINDISRMKDAFEKQDLRLFETDDIQRMLEAKGETD